AVQFKDILLASGKLIALDKLELSYIEQVVSLIKERATFVPDLWELGDYFFVAPEDYEEKALKKQWKGDTAEIMIGLQSVIENISDFSSDTIEDAVKNWIAETGLSFGKVMPPLRLLIVGDLKGPHLFDIMALIGAGDSIERIKRAAAREFKV